MSLKTKIKKFKELGIKNSILTIFYRSFYTLLMCYFKFDKWHAKVPYFYAKYKEIIVNMVNSMKVNKVVEIGCGLGEIISRIDAKEKYGFDIDKNVLRAARFLHKNVVFKEGSFDDIINFYHDVDIVIAVNFLHMYDEATVRNIMKRLVYKTKVKYIIIDRYTEDYIKRQQGKIIYTHHLEEYEPSFIPFIKQEAGSKIIILYKVNRRWRAI